MSWLHRSPGRSPTLSNNSTAQGSQIITQQSVGIFQIWLQTTPAPEILAVYLRVRKGKVDKVRELLAASSRRDQQPERLPAISRG
jgi:hypothetical protein